MRALTARYTELRSQQSAREVLEARSRVVDAVRRTLHDSGHIEVDTPLLQHAHSATGRSFRTETQSLHPHLYLRSSPLHLRAMLTTGLAKVFEIGRSFRDEPPDATHSPEYSLIELYQSGATYQTMRSCAQELITTAAHATCGSTSITASDGTSIDLAGLWLVVPFHAALTTTLDRRVDADTTAAELARFAAQHHVPVRNAASADDIALELYDHLVKPATITPTLHTDFPASLSPLAQVCAHDHRVAQKWDLVIDGREIATSYTELADPDELRQRLTPGGDGMVSAEAATLEDEWLDIFAAGMPPAGGLCIGLERLLLILTEATTVDQVIPFPLTGSS